jgi:hypothetical protein
MKVPRKIFWPMQAKGVERTGLINEIKSVKMVPFFQHFYA